VGVEVREPHALAGQRVKVRRLDLAAEHAHIGESEVVTEDDDDVRTAGRALGESDGWRDERRREQADDASHGPHDPISPVSRCASRATDTRWPAPGELH
jgi:hypothetical protein